MRLGKEEQRLNRLSAEQVLAHARGLLKRCDLLALWKLCSRLSLHETLVGIDDPLSIAPTLNLEKARMLCDVVLTSRATYNELGNLPPQEDFRRILNDCHVALNNPTELASLRAASGTDRVHLEFDRFLVRQGAIQIAAQEPRIWERAGRLVAMLDVLPSRYPDRIPGAQRLQVQKVLRGAPGILGGSAADLGRGFADIILWQHAVHAGIYRAFVRANAHLRARPETNDERVRRQARLTLEFLDSLGAVDDRLLFAVDEILETLNRVYPGYPALARPRIDAFLRLAARSADELRTMLSRPEFQLGHASARLSPLERFPVVRVDGPTGALPRFVVPNHRHFAKSFCPILEFTLQEALGVDYEAARGALLHLYLRQLLEDRLPGSIVIPETRYDESRGGKDSPDITVIDTAAKRIIGVEVKGRGINLPTRLTIGDEELADNLNGAYDALRKLPRKIADMRAGRPEFSTWRDAIAATGETPPVLVAVVREGLHFLSRFTREQARLDSDHPLAELRDPYCLLSADDFERAVETARSTGRSFVGILEQHYARNGERDHTSGPAEWFGEEEMKQAHKTFAAAFVGRSEWSRASAENGAARPGDDGLRR